MATKRPLRGRASTSFDRSSSTIVAPSMVGSILIEPVLGEGGYVPAPVSFMRALRDLCDEHGILLIADEVQSGYGRTGRMWGFEHAGIVPDVVCVAKAIANGLPLSAIVSSRELQERWGRGAHGSTYGGNPVACAAGVAVLDTIRDEDLLANAVARGAELTAGLGSIAAEDDRIGDIRGHGLMIGVEFTRDRSTGEPDGELPDLLIAACADAGLLVLTCGASTRPSGGSRPSTSPRPRSPRQSRSSGRRSRRSRGPDGARARRGRGCPPRERGSAVLREELHDVVESKPTVATLADAVEGEFAAVTEPLDRVDVQVKHVGNFGRSEHRSQFVDGHRCHVVFRLILARELDGSGPLLWSGVGSSPLRGRAYEWRGGRA